MVPNSNLKAIILAAGEGTRLRPYTLEKPKCLVEIQGKSLLERQLDVLRGEGVCNIVLIGGYRADMLVRDGITLELNPRYAETNMVWTLFSAENQLSGDILICYGDIVYSREILRSVLASTADIAVAIDLEWERYWRARNENPLDDAETLKLTPEGNIAEIGQKPHNLQDIEGQYIGLIKLSTQGLETFRQFFLSAKTSGNIRGKTAEKAYMTDLLQAIIDAGHIVTAVPVCAPWVEVDTVSDLHLPVTQQRLDQISSEL